MHKQQLKPALFLAPAIVSTVVSVYALRANNEHMIKLRSAVYAADQSNGDTQKALNNLQKYVITHMNTELSAGPTPVYPPIQLKYTYDRLIRAQGDAVATANAQLYTEAQRYCEQQNSTDVSGRNRVPCIEAYVQQHNPQKLKQIPDALYKFAFTSPVWSPDVAGFSLVLAGLSWVAFAGSIILARLHRKRSA